MPMTIVRSDDTKETVAARLGIPSGTIRMDAVVVDAFESVGVSPKALRRAIVSHRPDFSRRKAPIDVPGATGIELYGNLEGSVFAMDRMVCGQVTYFSTANEDVAHVTDYDRMTDTTDIHAEMATGRRLRDVVRAKPFRSARSPRIASAEHRKGDALHMKVERVSVDI
jgi:hypothetical protein